jgi:hypothetical protein
MGSSCCSRKPPGGEDVPKIERPEKPEEYLVVNRASGKMLSHSAAHIAVRHFPPLIADEPPKRGGTDQGPTPLEYVLVALCA